MSLILSIDTTTAVSSAAISKNGQTIAYSENHIDRSHAAKLNSLIETTCAKSGIELNEIQAVAISKGPGSYTGLRIGVSGAKGLAYALQIPLIAIDTLKIMAKMAVSKIENQLTESSIIIPMIEARRDEVYSAIFDKNLNLIRNTEAEILNKTSFNEYSSKQIFICGDGSEKAVNIIDNKE
ncbi:MAG: tRNA (adenosine(37)-N6)-threonylcarbamoyltransferase complex dimerization subunit type 1 TsaB, partial [Bacteroidales bacterium]|nr:tRNA (adenosine(37)-N6)-threonylcarbamoyltransferase complex dimerization subunit type 1 TsaB [Bacteroidales bacterium]